MPTPSLKLTGNILLNLTDRAIPAPNPIEFLLASYSKSACLTYDELTPLTNAPVADGSVTAPKCMFVELESGVLDLAWDVAGTTVPTRLSMAADPVPAQRAGLILFTPVGTTRTLYITSVGTFRAKIWLFQ